ncbi:MAG: type VI secretion system baseplate subunit TssE [Planctomycetia bacterium]|nr:type VI secretion system baseplate subunit TssE [Planctomycetia bacterium]
MSYEPNTNVFKPSLLDRLLDANEVRYGQTLLQLEESILSDLQDLLNTRSPPRDQFANLPDAAKTVANYGLMDFSHLEIQSRDDRMQILDHIKTLIETYEPRLHDVEVVERKQDDVEKMAKGDFRKGALFFQIKARLAGNPGPEVSFETILELSKGSHTVKKELS